MQKIRVWQENYQDSETTNKGVSDPIDIDKNNHRKALIQLITYWGNIELYSYEQKQRLYQIVLNYKNFLTEEAVFESQDMEYNIIINFITLLIDLHRDISQYGKSSESANDYEKPDLYDIILHIKKQYHAHISFPNIVTHADLLDVLSLLDPAEDQNMQKLETLTTKQKSELKNLVDDMSYDILS